MNPNNTAAHLYDSVSCEAELQRMRILLKNQRQAYQTAPIPSFHERINDLKQLDRLVRDNQSDIIEAINADFGNRSANETLFCEIYVVLEGIKDTIKQLKKWMKPQKRHVNHMMYPGASNRVIPQPLGVVGVIVPWNFPVNLTFAPLTSIFAAGNRAIVKMSDRSLRLSHLLKTLSGQYFSEDKLAFVSDEHLIGPAFSALPFDHLLFTGSGATGRAVMRNAAENLTPVTLELGGKSPAVVSPDFSIKTAADRLMFWKLLNAGQICTTVDYLFVPEDKLTEFVDQARQLVAQRYPDLRSSDYTSVIDDSSFQRLQDTLEDAQKKGATLIRLSKDDSDAASRKLAPHILLNVNDEMQIMQRETFGPLLPIMTYSDPQQVVDYINSHDRPLALYPFTNDHKLRDFYIERCMSGGVSVNNCLLHVGQHDLPFGGIGPSGMGHYHGYEGFVTFSKMRPVFQQGFFDGMKPLMPPYGPRAKRLLDFLIKLTR